MTSEETESHAVTDEIGRQALEAAAHAGIRGPGDIADTNILSSGEISNRLQMLEMRSHEAEALLTHIFATILRSVDPAKIIAEHKENMHGETVGQVLDETARGRVYKPPQT